jgi:hypothetical protein
MDKINILATVAGFNQKIVESTARRKLAEGFEQVTTVFNGWLQSVGAGAITLVDVTAAYGADQIGLISNFVRSHFCNKSHNNNRSPSLKFLFARVFRNVEHVTRPVVMFQKAPLLA